MAYIYGNGNSIRKKQAISYEKIQRSSRVQQRILNPKLEPAVYCSLLHCGVVSIIYPFKNIYIYGIWYMVYV